MFEPEEQEIDSAPKPPVTLPRMEPIKPSYEEPPILDMKALLEHLEYAFLMDDSKLPVIINASLTPE